METVLSDPLNPMHQRSSLRHIILSVKFKFDRQHVYTMEKGIYSIMICSLYLSGGYQYQYYIHYFLMDP